MKVMGFSGLSELIFIVQWNETFCLREEIDQKAFALENSQRSCEILVINGLMQECLTYSPE